MIYKNNVLLDWNKKTGHTPDEKEVYDQIIAIKNKYFSENSMQRINLLYPKGAPREADGGWTQLKKFAIPMKSSDGRWRYTESIRTDKKANQGFSDHHKYITHNTLLVEKDIELIWFLLHKSPVLNKYVFFEDLEGDAREEVEEMASDADIRYMIMSHKSPIANNEKLIREVASVFGVPNVSKIGINQVRRDLYDILVEGNEYGDKFCNYETFFKLVDGEKAMKAAYIARCAIEDNIVGYKQGAWWIMEGRSYEEKLVTVQRGEANNREQAFINAVVEDDNVRSRLFAVMGEDEDITIDDLRALDRPVLQKRYKELTGEFLNTKKEEIIAELCKEYDIPYTPLTV